jgi:hypothetical protein
LATLDGNLAKARLLGEGQGEGRFPCIVSHLALF